MKKKERLGIAIKMQEGDVNFIIFSITLHIHPKHDESNCFLRNAIIFTFFNLDIAIGMMR